jgi:hypothetical protein
MPTWPSHDPGPKHCNVCLVEVSYHHHRQHNAILEAIMGSGLPGSDNIFTHCVGPHDQFDYDGGVVVCDRCLINELQELNTSYLH